RAVGARATDGGPGGARHAQSLGMEAGADYEFAPLRIPPGTSRAAAATMLSLQADTGGAELAPPAAPGGGPAKVTPPPPFAPVLPPGPRDLRPVSPSGRGG